MIPQNKTYLPPKEEYGEYLDYIWESGWVTNDGALLNKLETKLEEYLDAEYVRVVSSGTFALQLAIRALDLEGPILTTPFSYVATTGALVWEKCDPIFADIDPETLTIDVKKARDAITPETGGVLSTHVFGVPCAVEALRSMAEAHNIPLIYDGAHAFGTEMGGRSLLTYGDVTAVSFHATKLFHTVEGGAVITSDRDVAEQVELMRAFGHRGPNHLRSGINAKNSELHAAMGLCLLPRIRDFIDTRRRMYELYRSLLQDLPLDFQTVPSSCDYNYSYFPVLFPSSESRRVVRQRLADREIRTRRYFAPALNQLPYVDGSECPVAESTVNRVLCLPFFQEITPEQIRRVASTLHKVWPDTT